MLTLFVFILFLNIWWIARPHLARTNLVVCAMTLYFMAINDFVDQFFATHESWIVQKFLIYLIIIIPPLILMIACGARSGIRIALSVIITFVFLLPFTRPTLAFLRALPGWKIHIFESRFVENLSRVNPTIEDVSILRNYCDSLSDDAKNRLIAHLRAFPVSERSNDCLARASLWNGPQPAPVANEHHSDNEWRKLFHSAGPDQQAAIFDQLGKDNVLKDEAIQCLESGQDRLIVSAVFYLRRISGAQIGNDAVRWKKLFDSGVGTGVASMFSSANSSPLAQRGFSAIQMQDDLMKATEDHEDFLTVHMQRHFPKTISEQDTAVLIHELNAARRMPQSPSNFYRVGTISFWLALAETRKLKEGQNIDVPTVSGYWKLAVESLQLSGFIGAGLSQEITNIFERADVNHNGALDTRELESILAQRPV